ncbi:MAG: peptide chain release factor-like protein [Kiritimatiellae bacterium]|nr:peptide chain release factor-like protein [Kiritimatiellia bacterium]
MLSPETIEKIKEKMALAHVFEEDLTETFILGSGPGGQKINKTSSTVRLYHEPSGMTVKYGQARSREMNRWLARRELAERILERDQAEKSERRKEQERIRRQKRRRSRRQRAKMLEEKHQHSEKKAARRPVKLDE